LLIINSKFGLVVQIILLLSLPPQDKLEFPQGTHSRSSEDIVHFYLEIQAAIMFSEAP
jgi:hypothetical protein